MAKLFIAHEGFATADAHGITVRVSPGDVAEEGNWVLLRAPLSFRPLEIKFPDPDAPAEDALPVGVRDLGSGWFMLADGETKVHGHRALAKALNKV